MWLSQCSKQIHAFPPIETDVTRPQQADSDIDFRRKGTTMPATRTCKTFECREVGASPSGWRSSRAAVTADGTSTSAICPYMDMGAMVDVPHACNQEVDVRQSPRRTHTWFHTNNNTYKPAQAWSDMDALEFMDVSKLMPCSGTSASRYECTTY